MVAPDRRQLTMGLAASVFRPTAAGAANDVAAPPRLRGTVYAHRAPGVTLGPGQTQARQTATLAGLQAALAEAAASNKFFEIEPNTYEIFGNAGLIVPPEARNFKWVGSVGSRLVQFCADAPILTIGDTGANGYAAHQTITGFSLDYGADTSAASAAIALRLGASAWVLVEQFIACTDYRINPPSVGLAVTTANADNKFFFQNTIRNGEIGGGRRNLLSIEVDGTGNLWEDIYTHFGSDAASRQSCSGPAWNLEPPGQMDDNVFVRCNIEHVNSSALIRARGALNCTFIGLHIEDAALMGQQPAVVSQFGGQLRFIDSLVMDLALPRESGRAAVHRAAGYGERAAFEGLHFKWSDYAGGALGAQLRIVEQPLHNDNDTNPAVSIGHLTVEDDSGSNGPNLLLNSLFDQPLIDGAFVARMQDDNLLPTTNHMQMTITAPYIHYGMHEDAVLFVPAAIISFAISLSDKFKASGKGSALAPRPGERLRIRRQTGEPSGTLTIIDAATTKTLTTNTAAGVDLLFVFEMKTWALVD